MSQSSSEGLRKSGIETVGEVPWGTHFCQFYQTPQDLIDTVVPYIVSGLQANEFCMWITSDQLNAETAISALKKSLPDIDDRLHAGQIEILSYNQWYILNGKFSQQRVLDAWIAKLDYALNRGYEGLRLSADTFWLEQNYWQDFTAYEEVIDTTIRDNRMIAMCTYSLNKCGAAEVADVISNHEYALMKRDGKWMRIESSTVQQSKQALQKLNRTLTAHINSSRAMMYAQDELAYLNEACRIVVEDCGHQMVWIGYAQHDNAKSVRTVAQYGFDESYLEKLDVSWADTPRGQGPSGTAIRTGEVSLCKNMHTDPNFEPWRELALKRGYASSVALPLRIDGQVMGAMAIYSSEPDAFTKDEIQLLTNLAEDLSYGISAIRMRQERIKATKALQESEQRVKAKLESILSPEGDIGDLELSDILDIELVQSLMNSFYKLIRIPMAIIDPEGRVLVKVGWQEICTNFHRTHPITLNHCLESDVELSADIKEGEAKLYKCKNNLWDLATPIMIGGRHLGNLFIGQFLFRDEVLDLELFRRQAKICGFNEQDYMEALSRVPRVNKDTLNAGMAFFMEFAGVISQLSYGNIKLARSLTERNALMESLSHSERRYRFLAENMQDVIWIADVHTMRYRYVSQSVERLCGYTVDEVLAAPIWQFLTPESAKSMQSLMQMRTEAFSLNKLKQAYYTDYFEMCCRDGTVITTEVVTRYYLNEINGAVEALGVTKDVTQRKRAEFEAARAREESEHRAAQLESLISSMHDGLVLFDTNHTVLMANEALRKLVGAPSDGPSGLRMNEWKLYWLDDSPVAKDDYPSRRALRGMDTRDVRFRIISPWNESIVSVSGSPVRDAQGKILGGTLSVHDTSDQIEYERRLEEIYKREHHIAQVLQQALIPPRVPTKVAGFRIGVRYQPALKEAEIGGDFYDVFDIGQNRVGILIGDVAGKGLEAAIRVAAARYALRSYAVIEPHPATVMKLANRALCMDGDYEAGILTAFFAVIDTSNDLITYSCAGHEPPVICRASGEIEELPIGGLPLGVSMQSEYHEDAIQLAHKDTIVLVTDGITEARAGVDKFFEKKGMIHYLANSSDISPQATASGLLRAAINHAGGKLQDDAAVVVVRLDIPQEAPPTKT